jgi:ABC-type uncharacterized transport system permease subunit
MDRLKRMSIGLAAPALAFVFAIAVTWILLLATGHSPVDTFRSMGSYGIKPDSLTLTFNLAVTYYLSAIAVAIGFRMNLFNIGVDGQYRLAALIAAAVGGVLHLPPVIDVTLIILTAIVIGALWASIAAVLKTRRGVSEVISTIMLNYISTGVIAFLLTTNRLAVAVQGSNNIGTKPIPANGQVPSISLIHGATSQVYGLAMLAVAVGFGYWYLLNRTRFGFDLRATGLSATAAVASGVNVKRMVLRTMLLSGAVAGLVGIPTLLGGSYSYSLDFPTGLGFTGIAIALLGRNSPIGVAFGALLWAFLDSSRQILDLTGVSKEIVTVMQGVAVLAVVVAYELVRRYRMVQQQRVVGQRLSVDTPGSAEAVTA